MNVYEIIDGIAIDKSKFLFHLEEANAGEIISHNKSYYVVSEISKKNNEIGVEKINLDLDGEERHYEDDIICPYCGHENYDYMDDHITCDSVECEKCGFLFHLEREVIVQYSTKPVRQDINIRKIG